MGIVCEHLKADFGQEFMKSNRGWLICGWGALQKHRQLGFLTAFRQAPHCCSASSYPVFIPAVVHLPTCRQRERKAMVLSLQQSCGMCLCLKKTPWTQYRSCSSSLLLDIKWSFWPVKQRDVPIVKEIEAMLEMNTGILLSEGPKLWPCKKLHCLQVSWKFLS